MAEGMHQLGKYRIVEELGAGGFATVFKAIDTTLEREVALKILHPPLLADRRFVHNFRQEAKTLAALRHPQIITIYEVGEIDGRIFIAMELARGISLAKAIASRQHIPWLETIALLKPVCEALDYAHEQNVVHRDLKPANILIDKQRGALLTDFGFARLLAENSASMSMSGGIVGTPGYIAPEVWENNAADAPVDIYALGCIAYEMLTGDVLFKGQTPIQAMRAHDRGPQFPATWPQDTPGGIADALRKALAREPAERYASAGALWHALNDLEVQLQMEREAAQRAEATKREAEQRADVAAQWRAEAERAIDVKEWDAARMAIGRWHAVEPDDPAIQEVQSKLERLTAAVEVREEILVDLSNTQSKSTPVTTIRSLPQMSALKKTSSSTSPTQRSRISILGILLITLFVVTLAGMIIFTMNATPVLAPTADTPAEEAVLINISTAGEALQFAPTTLSAIANQPVSVTFKDASSMEKHNWVLVNGADDVAQQVDEAGAATGEDNGYIPDDPNIVAHINLLDGGSTDSASFSLPAGTYSFLCTFPGHYAAGMKGTLSVE